MPPKAQINEIEQNRMVNPQFAPANIKAVANPNIAAAAESVAAVADTLGKIQQHNDALKMDTFEKQLDIMKYDYDTSLQKDGNPDNFGTLLNAHKETVLQKGKEVLGDRLFNIWQKQYSQNYFDYLKADTDRTALPLAKKLEVKNTLADIKQAAYNYALVKTEVEQLHLDKDVEEKINKYPPLVQKELRDKYTQLRDTQVNEKTYLSALSMAYKEPNALVETILDIKEWRGLKAEQREHLLNLSQAQINARKGTFLKKDVQKFNDFYAQIAETAPETARTLLNDMLKNPASRESTADLKKLLGEENTKQFYNQIKSLDKNDFDKVLNGWETIADSADVRLGLEQLSAMGQIEFENNNLGYKTKDGDIELMDKSASENIGTDSLLQKIGNIQNNYGYLTNRKLKKSANKIIENFKSYLGSSVKKDTGATEERGFWAGMILPGESRGDKLYGDSDDYIKNVLVSKYPSLSDAEIGEAYYRFRKNAEKNKFDLNDNSTEAKAASLKLLNNIMAQNLGVKYNAPADVQNIIADGAAMPLNPAGKNAAGIPQSAVKQTEFKIIDGAERLVEYDAQGKMVKIYDAERY